jgi:hypothetical protein
MAAILGSPGSAKPPPYYQMCWSFTVIFTLLDLREVTLLIIKIAVFHYSLLNSYAIYIKEILILILASSNSVGVERLHIAAKETPDLAGPNRAFTI